MVELNYRPLNALALGAKAAASADAANVHLWELPKRRMITLRLDPSNAALVAKAEGALGFTLPTKPNTFTATTSDGYALWTSPDEWMIDLAWGGPDGGDAAILQALSDALAGEFASVVDVSDQMAGVGLGGQQWRDVWSKVCALDMDLSVFGAWQCTQTTAAKTNILAYGPDTSDAAVSQLRLYTRRSFSQYLFARFEDAALEYGLSLKAL